MTQQRRAFRIVEGALVSFANGRASGRDYYGFGHYLPQFWGQHSMAASGKSSGLLRVPHQMIGGVTELDVEGAYPLEVVADVQFIAHAHAAMQLHGLLCDKFGRVPNLGLRAGRQLRSIWLSGREAEVQMLRERDCLLKSDKHIDHAMLQYLKGPKRYP